MATFEERELVDYAFKKVQNFMDKSFMVKDLDKLHSRIKKAEETQRIMIERIRNLENRVRILEEKENRNSLIDGESSTE